MRKTLLEVLVITGALTLCYIAGELIGLEAKLLWGCWTGALCP